MALGEARLRPPVARPARRRGRGPAKARRVVWGGVSGCREETVVRREGLSEAPMAKSVRTLGRKEGGAAKGGVKVIADGTRPQGGSSISS